MHAHMLQILSFEHKYTSTELLIRVSSFSWKTPSIFQKQSPEMLCEKGVLRNFAKFTGKHLCQSFFFNKVAALSSRAQVFCCEFFEISKETFSERTPLMATSDFWRSIKRNVFFSILDDRSFRTKVLFY